MPEGADFCLDIGCGDGFRTRIVSPFVNTIVAIDFYKPHIEEAKNNGGDEYATFYNHDFLDGWSEDNFNVAYALDVLEHIDEKQESKFLQTVVRCLYSNGTFICGMPTLESQRFASDANVKAHINCQDPEVITATLKQYFTNVFSFGFNDEVLHTGHDAMRHYQMNLCCGPKK